MKKMKKETWKTILQSIVTVLTALTTKIEFVKLNYSLKNYLNYGYQSKSYRAQRRF